MENNNNKLRALMFIVSIALKSAHFNGSEWKEINKHLWYLYENVKNVCLCSFHK
jgi:hypothetical protein